VKVDAFMVEFIAKERGVAPVPELLPAWTWHDTRRTMRTIMSKLRVEYEIRELCLAHVKNGLDARYDFHDFAAEKRDALEQWGDWVARIARPLKVIKKLAKVA
jgi:hypothetical protein